MDETDRKDTVFISYAWGGSIEKKEWIRNEIVSALSGTFSIFWDRDSVPFGGDLDTVISSVLSNRPIIVLCLCDRDYVLSAYRLNSGLHRELALLEKIIKLEGVRIIPIILDRECISHLPSPLAGKIYLDLSELYVKNIYMGDMALEVSLGGSQANIAVMLSNKLRCWDVKGRAERYFSNSILRFWGNARTHVVTNNNNQILFPPKWMWESPNWSYMLSDEGIMFCPKKGIWPWDNPSVSKGVRAFATAMCSAFFHEKTDEKSIKAIERAAVFLAQDCISFFWGNEPLMIDSQDVINALINHDVDVLDQLISP